MSVDLKLRYWVFVCETYYPEGGLRDVRLTSDDHTDALAAAKAIKTNAVQILDVEAREVIWSKP